MRGRKNKNNLLIKTTITFLALVVLILVGIPFSKYFLIASNTQTSKMNVHTKMPDKISASELIQAPNLSILMKQDSQGYSIGQIVIPEASISQPIYLGLTNENLAHGTVNLFPNRRPSKNTLTIIGHHVFNYGGHHLLFGAIQNLNKNDSVYIRYMNQYYEYKVNSNNIINETDVDRLVDIGPDYIYLMTCNQSVKTPYRVLVTAKKVEKSESSIKTSFNDYCQEIIRTNHQYYLLWYILPAILLLLLVTVFLFFVWWF